MISSQRLERGVVNTKFLFATFLCEPCGKTKKSSQGLFFIIGGVQVEHNVKDDVCDQLCEQVVELLSLSTKVIELHQRYDTSRELRDDQSRKLHKDLSGYIGLFICIVSVTAIYIASLVWRVRRYNG